MAVPTMSRPSPLSTLVLTFILVTAVILGVVARDEGLSVAIGRFLTAPGATLVYGTTKIRAALGRIRWRDICCND